MNQGCSITYYKKHIAYFIHSLERRIIILLQEGLNENEISYQIEETKKNIFDKIFVL